MINNIALTLEKIRTNPEFIDLINSNFTLIKPLFPKELLIMEFNNYLKDRTYNANPKGLLSARKAISKYYLSRNIEVDPENIILTASTSESYSLIFKTMTGAGDTILIPRPGYPLFEYIADYEHTKTNYYDLDPNNFWQPILRTMSDKAQGVVIISPNNPTGSICNQSNLDLIYNKTILQKQFLIIDEVFSAFNFTKSNLPVIKAENIKTPIFLLNGISKMFGLPDLKLAWIAIPGKTTKKTARIIDALETINDTYLNSNYYSQFALEKIFAQADKYQNELLQLLKRNLNTLTIFIAKNKQYLNCNLPQGGIHSLIELNFESALEEDFVIKLLRTQKLYVHPGYFYEYKSKKASIIISLLNSPKKFSTALSRLHQYGIEYSLS